MPTIRKIAMRTSPAAVHPSLSTYSTELPSRPATAAPVQSREDKKIVRLEIFPRETLHVSPNIIDGIIALDHKQKSSENPFSESAQKISALKTVVKILTNFHGNYPASCVERMDAPDLSANGNRCFKLKFADQDKLRHAPEETHHVYCEVNQEKIICLLSVRKENGDILCDFSAAPVRRRPTLRPALQRSLMETLKFRENLPPSPGQQASDPMEVSAGEGADKRPIPSDVPDKRVSEDRQSLPLKKSLMVKLKIQGDLRALLGQQATDPKKVSAGGGVEKRPIPPDADASLAKRQCVAQSDVSAEQVSEERQAAATPTATAAAGAVKGPQVTQAAWDTWQAELTAALEASDEERPQMMATARRNWLTALIGEDPNAPDKYWNVPGVSPTNKNRNVWRWNVAIKGVTYQGRTPSDRNLTSAAAWGEAVIEAEAIRTLKNPKRFGEGDWQPPLSLKGITVMESAPKAWRALFLKEKKQLSHQLSFDPENNGPEPDKKRQWDNARETQAQMKNGSYKAQ